MIGGGTVIFVVGLLIAAFFFGMMVMDTERNKAFTRCRDAQMTIDECYKLNGWGFANVAYRQN